MTATNKTGKAVEFNGSSKEGLLILSAPKGSVSIGGNGVESGLGVSQNDSIDASGWTLPGERIRLESLKGDVFTKGTGLTQSKFTAAGVLTILAPEGEIYGLDANGVRGAFQFVGAKEISNDHNIASLALKLKRRELCGNKPDFNHRWWSCRCWNFGSCCCCCC